MSSPPLILDEIDRKILALLEQNARRTVRDIAHRVQLTVAPVKRRIERMEEAGVIAGYTVRIDAAKAGAGLEAITELRIAGDMQPSDIVTLAERVPEVREVWSIAGDPDALVRIRTANVQELQRVISELRAGGRVTGTKTLVVINSWSRGE